MKFIIQNKIFEKINNLYVGVVIANGVDNTKNSEVFKKMLSTYTDEVKDRYLGEKMKDDKDIIPYRNAFRKLNINPNKYRCSIEALFTRISKGKRIPSINPLVDLNNAISLKHILPMGTHDLTGVESEDIQMRFSVDNDVFVPMGSDEVEKPDKNEVVYAIGNDVRTRHWTWRQSNHGKISENTHTVFFPIDGFKGINDDRVDAAVKDLKTILINKFNCSVQTGYVDKNTPEFSWNNIDE
ncbi:hypothetical protein FHL06_10070 [Lactobacillus halodurans]|uniref:B3/B4 tRNA-binding domain-containing protein n=1 Tax=Companilactobacillus halodurans TaxID=2584183 RepID=A0A5P0ZRN2_9LACO|nr:phenylalanine--tRNA ligase beta subunit-related protein [Companilactobacillus halodurans]MQS76715.1 hypothetical protein [Companilactobacillus halodurans]